VCDDAKISDVFHSPSVFLKMWTAKVGNLAGLTLLKFKNDKFSRRRECMVSGSDYCL
jgi:hypothetical protein